MKFFSMKFLDSVLLKLISTLTSVKVWVLITTFAIAIWIIIIAKDQSDPSVLIKTATTMIISVVGVVVVMREGFKITAVKDKEKSTELQV